MTDFDARLRAALGRLDAAVPPPRTVTIPARPAAQGQRFRRWIVLLAATAILSLATAVVATSAPPPPDPSQLARDAADEERVRDDLAQYTENACLTPVEAKTLFRERLDDLGLRDWQVRVDARIKEAPCVSGSPIGDAHEVLLMPSMGGDVARALDRAGLELLRRCLGRDAAVELIRSTLVGAGIPDPHMNVGGIRAVPVDNPEAFMRHVADGCYVYGGAQFDEVGRYTFFVSGQ